MFDFNFDLMVRVLKPKVLAQTVRQPRAENVTSLWAEAPRATEKRAAKRIELEELLSADNAPAES